MTPFFSKKNNIQLPPSLPSSLKNLSSRVLINSPLCHRTSVLRLLVFLLPLALTVIKVTVAAGRAHRWKTRLRRRQHRKRVLHSPLLYCAAPSRSPTAFLIAPQSLAPFSDSASRSIVIEDRPLVPDRVSTGMPHRIYPLPRPRAD